MLFSVPNTRMCRRWVAIVGLAVAFLPAVSHAQILGNLLQQRTAADSLATPVSLGSPRASMQEFQRLARANDWAGASDFLAVPPARSEDAEQLARRLKVVLDQRLSLNMQDLSPLVVGDTTDGDPLGDRVGVIVGRGGHEYPVRLVQAPRNGRMRWVFSSATVTEIDGWYETLGAPWLRDRLPAPLMHEGPWHVFYWQWIGLLLVVPALMLFAWIIGVLSRAVLSRAAKRTTTEWDDLIVEHLSGPYRLWVAALAAPFFFGLLSLQARLASFISNASSGLVLLAFFWALLRLTRLGQRRIETTAWKAGEGAQARTLVPLLSNILRVTIAIIALLVALAQFGYPVGTLLAGLGIGGIGVALAAQKTVEHLFGSVSLAADHAFRVGDWVRAGTSEGEVERIGLRSTSLRTVERTVVRIPNGRLADERIETFGERDRILLRTDIDLAHATPSSTVEQIRDDIEAALRANPQIWPDKVRVHVVSFTDSAIRINVNAWFLVPDFDAFLKIRHGMLLEFMRILERRGTQFALPSRTVYHVTKDGAALHSNSSEGGATMTVDE